MTDCKCPRCDLEGPPDVFGSEWLPIHDRKTGEETTPKGETEFLVGGFVFPRFAIWADPKDYEPKTWKWSDGDEPEVHGPPAWRVALSQYEDKPTRRGFRHRNGANFATHWMPIARPPIDVF